MYIFLRASLECVGLAAPLLTSPIYDWVRTKSAAVARDEFLKGHGNEADFLGFLQILGPHRSLTLPFEPFRFWL